MIKTAGRNSEAYYLKRFSHWKKKDLLLRIRVDHIQTRMFTTSQATSQRRL